MARLSWLVGGRVLAWCAALLVIAVLFPSCRGGCSSDDVLAELAEKNGSVDRDNAQAVAQWTAAALGAEFRLGDGLRTGPAGSASLDLPGGGRVRVESDTIIRFRAGVEGQSQTGLEVELGSAEVAAGAQAVSVKTSVGTAVVESQGALKVSAEGGGFRFVVSVGRVRLEDQAGKSRTLEKGDSLDIGIGEAVVDEKPPPPEPTAPPKPDGGVEAMSGPIAAQVSGRGALKKAPGDKTFSPLAPGKAELPEQTVLRLKRGTSVAVSRGDQQATLVGSGEFVVGGNNRTLVQVQSGTVSFADAGGAVRIAAPGGAIVTEPQAAGDVTVGKDETKVAVRARQVTVHSPKGTEVVEAGQSATLDHEGAAEVIGRSLGYSDIVFPAGDSAIVHDPKPPTAVGYALGGACPEGAVIRVLKGGKVVVQARGEGTPSLAIPAGSYSYEIACVEEGTIAEKPRAEGHVTIVADAGTAPLPKSAPATRVEADGRYYTVLYQNQLPALTIAWTRSPKAPSYSLAVTSYGRTSTFSSSKPVYSFRSGQLSEGIHKFRFGIPSGGKSKTTTVAIHFDNAAPTATLRSPANRSFGPGASVTVSGIALPGWIVRAGGEPFTVDGQYRFSGSAVAPSDGRALDIVFSHPSRGTHHYLRRTSGAH